jgi:hypothetical protein
MTRRHVAWTRLYHPPSMPEFQTLKRKLEDEWVPAVHRRGNYAQETAVAQMNSDDTRITILVVRVTPREHNRIFRLCH